METPKLLTILGGGDLRSDGRSDEVVSKVLTNPSLLPELIKGLSVRDDVIRGRTADVLEKVARIYHEMMVPYLPMLLLKAIEDDVYMVRFHLAMLFGYLEVSGDMKKQIIGTLVDLLSDSSVFVQSWSIVSLTIIGLEDEFYRDEIIEKIKPLLASKSIAVRRKAENSISTLKYQQPLPKGWAKKHTHS